MTVYSVAGVILVAAYAPLFMALSEASATNRYAGHVLLVPIFAGALVWLERRRFRHSGHGGHLSGAGISAAGLAVAAVAYRTGSIPAYVVSFVIVVAGIVVWSHGVDGLRRARFVLAFLLLMIPPPRELIAAVTPPIAQWVAAFSTIVLESVRIPVQQQGITLQLPGMTLIIAEECAGLRFLLILFVFVAAFARTVVPTTAGQLLIVLLSIPVAMIANAARVAFISVGTHVIGPTVATGPLHDYIGKGFWLIAVTTMVGCAMLLRSRSRPLVVTARRSPDPFVSGAA